MGWRWYRKLCVLLTVIGLFSASVWATLPSSPIEIVKDRDPPFQLDPTRPFQISVSRSSPMSGENEEVTIFQDSRVVITRSVRLPNETSGPPKLRRETATFTISRDELGVLLASVESNELMKLHLSYRRTDTFDGIHESLTIKQGDREKWVSCTNHFPEGFERFRKRVDAVVLGHNFGLKWREAERLPRYAHRQHSEPRPAGSEHLVAKASRSLPVAAHSIE